MQYETDELLAGMDTAKQREICLSVSRRVIERTNVRNEAVISALSKIETGEDADITALNEASQQTEKLYLEAQREGVTDTHLDEFRQARAIDSLKFALEGDYSRSLYEALHALDSNIEAIKQFIQEV